MKNIFRPVKTGHKIRNITKILAILAMPFILITLLLFYHGNYDTRIYNRIYKNFALTSKKEINALTSKKEINCHEAESVYVYNDLGYKWTKITCAAEFAPRDGAGALVFKDSLRLIGGWNPNDKNNFPLICNNEVWSSANGRNWVRTKPNTFVNNKSFDSSMDWEGRHSAGYVVYNNKMWILGGDANQGHYQSDIWNSYDGRKWELVQNTAPWSPRVLHHTLVFKDKVWVIGGQTIPQFAHADENFYNDIWSSEDGAKWELVNESAPFSPRGMIGGSAVFNDKIWILGGGTYDTPNTPTREFYNDIWCSEDGLKWELVNESAPWTPRQYHEVAVWDNKLWVLEGYSKESGNRNDVWFSDNGRDWLELPNTPWKERHAAGVFAFKNSLWIVTGNNMESDVWKLEKMQP